MSFKESMPDDGIRGAISYIINISLILPIDQKCSYFINLLTLSFSTKFFIKNYFY